MVRKDADLRLSLFISCLLAVVVGSGFAFWLVLTIGLQTQQRYSELAFTTAALTYFVGDERRWPTDQAELEEFVRSRPDVFPHYHSQIAAVAVHYDVALADVAASTPLTFPFVTAAVPLQSEQTLGCNERLIDAAKHALNGGLHTETR